MSKALAIVAILVIAVIALSSQVQIPPSSPSPPTAPPTFITPHPTYEPCNPEHRIVSRYDVRAAVIHLITKGNNNPVSLETLRQILSYNTANELSVTSWFTIKGYLTISWTWYEFIVDVEIPPNYQPSDIVYLWSNMNKAIYKENPSTAKKLVDDFDFYIVVYDSEVLDAQTLAAGGSWIQIGAENLVNQDVNRLSLAHEICHLFGATDHYNVDMTSVWGPSPYPLDFYGQYDIMGWALVGEKPLTEKIYVEENPVNVSNNPCNIQTNWNYIYSDEADRFWGTETLQYP